MTLTEVFLSFNNFEMELIIVPVRFDKMDVISLVLLLLLLFVNTLVFSFFVRAVFQHSKKATQEQGSRVVTEK